MELNKEFSTIELKQWIKDLECELRKARRVTQIQLERSCFLQAYLDLLMAERAQMNTKDNDSDPENNDN